MKKSNKGFTLVELLAIILIIALIGIIAVPNISKQMKKNEDRQQRLLNQRITNAAHTYAAKYYADKMVDDDETDVASFTLENLEQDGLLDLNDNECKDKDSYTRKNVAISVTRNDANIFFNFDNIINYLTDCATGDKNGSTLEKKGIYALW